MRDIVWYLETILADAFLVSSDSIFHYLAYHSIKVYRIFVVWRSSWLVCLLPGLLMLLNVGELLF
jgi:hypothetical protein